MQIVIDIPDKVYSYIITQCKEISEDAVDAPIIHIIKSIISSIPLPKGHGRIIDESKITTLYTYVPNAFCKGGGWKTEDFTATNTDAPTIVDSDKNMN